MRRNFNKPPVHRVHRGYNNLNMAHLVPAFLMPRELALSIAILFRIGNDTKFSQATAKEVKLPMPIPVTKVKERIVA